jgi:hypothetical protein
VADGMSIPEELARREERLAKLAEARAKLEARAKERFEREMAEHRAKLAARDEKTAASGKKPGGRTSLTILHSAVGLFCGQVVFKNVRLGAVSSCRCPRRAWRWRVP